jgi:hypothetical protein
MKYIFIDIRKSDEVYSTHFDQSQDYSFYNIPMNMIRFNAQNIINHLEYVDEIYIVCQSSCRSQFIKDKYFKDHQRIKVSQALQFCNLKFGLNDVSLNENTNIKINIVGSNSFNYYNIMRILQTILGIIMILVGGYTFMQLKKKDLLKNINTAPLIILIIIGIMTLFNGFTSTCTTSILLKDYLN